jgi:segregation and condensation protein B
MRKKRKLQARAEAQAEQRQDLEAPELLEAMEAEVIALDLEEAEGSLDEQQARLATLKRILESVLFAADKPLTIPRLEQLTKTKDRELMAQALDELVAEYAHRGIVLHDVAGGYQFRTHPDSSEWVQQLVAGRPVRLSRAQLETLAIIAYRQPITRPEIDEIRGVDSGGTLKLLLDRSLVRVLGKKEEPGRPLLYGTTKEFLEFFNLHGLRDLPTLREYHELTEDSMREVEEKLGSEAAATVGDIARELAERDPGSFDAAQDARAEEESESALNENEGAEMVAGAEAEPFMDEEPEPESSASI